MAINVEVYKNIVEEIGEKASLVAVSKTKPVEDIVELYKLGQRDFGENYVQELVEKEIALPKDIKWHFIGHLQSNKVKYIASFVHLIHGIDSLKLLQEVNKQAAKNNRVINCLLQVHIAAEETKFGFDENDIKNLDWQAITSLKNVKIVGLMGMASFTENLLQVEREFKLLKTIYDELKLKLPELNTISMGMSGDYGIAIKAGSNMVRIGSLLFGARNYNH